MVAAPGKKPHPNLRYERTAALDAWLLQMLAEGGTVTAFARLAGFPVSVVYRWIMEDAKLSAAVASARDAGALVLEELAQEWADRATPIDAACVKLRLWWLEKRLIWNQPTRYGQKVQLGGAADLPPIQLSDTERATRIDRILAKGRDRRLGAVSTNGHETNGNA